MHRTSTSLPGPSQNVSALHLKRQEVGDTAQTAREGLLGAHFLLSPGHRRGAGGMQGTCGGGGPDAASCFSHTQDTSRRVQNRQCLQPAELHQVLRRQAAEGLPPSTPTHPLRALGTGLRTGPKGVSSGTRRAAAVSPCPPPPRVGGSHRGPAALREDGCTPLPAPSAGRELMEGPRTGPGLPRFTQAPHRCPASRSPSGCGVSPSPRASEGAGGAPSRRRSSTAGPHWTRPGPRRAEPRRLRRHWRGWTLRRGSTPWPPTQRGQLSSGWWHPAPWRAQPFLLEGHVSRGSLGQLGWAGLGGESVTAPTPLFLYREDRRLQGRSAQPGRW